MNLIELVGEGDQLNALQMSIRAVSIFIFAIILLRISGRRSLGMNMPLDYVILFLLGAILSRAITGASPYVATLCASLTLVLLHRLFACLGLYNNTFGKLVKGSSKLLFKNDQFIDEQMESCSISYKDFMEALRLKKGLDSLDKIDKAFIERNGEISFIQKKDKDET